MNIHRRTDRLGVHSIGEFLMTVPSLKDAKAFYEAFGLNVSEEAGGLAMRTDGQAHVWGRLREGARKKFEHLTLHCFEDDLPALERHIRAQGVALQRAPDGADGGGLWLHSPDGMRVQVRAGTKTTLDAAAHQSPPLPVDGTPCAPYRRNTQAVRPTRLSHIALTTSSVPEQVDFYTRVLGLRMSDHSGDGVAFLHAPHGSDHHLVALAASAGPGLHHLSWDVPTVDHIGLGAMAMAAAGYKDGWGVGRHVLGSNYFYYAQDPWGSFCEYSATIDYIPAAANWEGQDHPPEDSFYLWGPDVPPAMFAYSEAGAWA